MQKPDVQEIRVILQPMNRVVTVPSGTSLLVAITLAGLSIESICGGKGTCGKCRVILDKGSCWDAPEIGTGCRLTQEEREAGYHLACQVTLADDAEFTIPVESRIDSPQILVTRPAAIGTPEPVIRRYRVELSPSEGLPFASQSIRFAGYTGLRPRMTDEQYHALLASDQPQVAIISALHAPPTMLARSPADGTEPLYGVAIDLGTTTVVGCLARLDTGEVLATASVLNRQITYGEELLTRIGYAASPAGLAALQKAAATSINDVIGTLALNAGIVRTAILDLCIGGNTVMNHLLCGLDVQYLELADTPVLRAPLVRAARDLGLAVHPAAEVYCLPNVSRFVGGDAIGDMIAAGMYASDELSLLVDLGTNGEIVLGNRHWAASVSCASGPAFEGAGIRAGMRAMKGAIDHVEGDPVTGEIRWSTIGSAPPRGICGSGIVDLAVAMVQTGALDFAGKLNFSHPRVRTDPEGAGYLLARASETGTGREIVITQQDIDYLMDSKAAACGAIAVLLARYKYVVGDIRHLYLAGAFGAYTDINNAVRFGILPRFPAAAVHSIGNGSLAGAYACLLSLKNRAAAESLAHHMVYIDLMVDTAFAEEYAAALYIPGRADLFPPVS
ncbi:ASKHA domain-containing protein [Methanoregula sp.]|uniref:ASKHA domain-containing protein n=1 Tax=Methanoregula sp. TaxID=2052170 RepID=UPI002BCC0FF1|nr:ASKHA domain-containing protein [Methanoregula sp.]HVP95796.1 ASKHA domain-containing protein [Methanoregula sp.]